METRTYCSPMVKQGFNFKVYEKDENGNYKKDKNGDYIIVYERDFSTGNTRYSGGRPIPVTLPKDFVTKSNVLRYGYLSEYTTDDEAEIDQLEKACDDPIVPITRLETYKENKNPALYRAEKEKAKVEAENKAMRDELKELRARAAALQAKDKR